MMCVCAEPQRCPQRTETVLVREGELHDNIPYMLQVERTPKVLCVTVTLTATVKRRDNASIASTVCR